MKVYDVHFLSVTGKDACLRGVTLQNALDLAMSLKKAHVTTQDGEWQSLDHLRAELHNQQTIMYLLPTIRRGMQVTVTYEWGRRLKQYTGKVTNNREYAIGVDGTWVPKDGITSIEVITR